jgi:hypothetical protein
MPPSLFTGKRVARAAANQLSRPGGDLGISEQSVEMAPKAIGLLTSGRDHHVPANESAAGDSTAVMVATAGRFQPFK